MKGLSKQFVPYEQSLQLVELGFDEECLGFYTELGNLVIKENVKQQDCVGTKCVAPLLYQTLEWFVKHHSLVGTVYSNASGYLFEIHYTAVKGGSHICDSGYEGDCELSGTFTSYHKATQQLVIKLIELCIK